MHSNPIPSNDPGYLCKHYTLSLQTLHVIFAIVTRYVWQCDVAPSILHIMGLEQPKEMTGKCLIMD